MKKTLLLSLFTALLAAACAAQPTLSPEGQAMVATAVEMTIIAKNSATVPQAVPVNMAAATPFPASPVMISADNPAAIPVQVSQEESRQDETSGGSDPCDKMLDTFEAGPLTNVSFKNKTGGDVQLGIYLWRANSYGQCGYVFGNTIHIPKGKVQIVSLPEGDYFAWAWVAYKNGETSAPKGNFSIGNSVINQSGPGAPSTDVVLIKQIKITK